VTLEGKAKPNGKGDPVATIPATHVLEYDTYEEGVEVEGSKLWGHDPVTDAWFPLGQTNRPNG